MCPSRRVRGPAMAEAPYHGMGASFARVHLMLRCAGDQVSGPVSGHPAATDSGAADSGGVAVGRAWAPSPSRPRHEAG